MTTKVNKSDYYGDVVWREFAGIDFIRVAQRKSEGEAWAKIFHPCRYFGSVGFNPAPEGATEEQKIRHLGCVVYSTPFESDNEDWAVKNKEFLKTPNTYGTSGGKEKILPTAISSDEFETWFAASNRYINSHWKENNPEFISFWESKVAETQNAFWDACKSGDMKVIRKSIKLNVEVNEHSGKGLSFAIENNHLNVVKYLLNKDAEIFTEMFPLTENKTPEILKILEDKWNENKKKELRIQERAKKQF